MEKPWVTGPKELLEHGVEHINKGTDFDMRMAMICIDNAVELSIKTFLGLPKRITKIEGLTRNKFEQIKESFPSIIDGLEQYASERLVGIELGDIEWFHRLRNELYHEGNGITVEKQKVETYKEIAILLFKRLFGSDINLDGKKDHSLIGQFISHWAEIENTIHFELGYFKGTKPTNWLLDEMRKKKLITTDDIFVFERLRAFRNELIHGRTYPTNARLIEMTKELIALNKKFRSTGLI